MLLNIVFGYNYSHKSITEDGIKCDYINFFININDEFVYTKVEMVIKNTKLKGENNFTTIVTEFIPENAIIKIIPDITSIPVNDLNYDKTYLSIEKIVQCIATKYHINNIDIVYEYEGYEEEAFIDEGSNTNIKIDVSEKIYNQNIQLSPYNRDMINNYNILSESFWYRNRNTAILHVEFHEYNPRIYINNDYIFIKDKNSDTSNLLVDNENPINKLFQISSSIPDCVGFNTYGFFKSYIDLNNLTPYDVNTMGRKDVENGLYIKKSYYNTQIQYLPIPKSKTIDYNHLSITSKDIKKYDNIIDNMTKKYDELNVKVNKIYTLLLESKITNKL